MSAPIEDPDVQILASIASSLIQEYFSQESDDPWVGSPFGWIRTRPSRQIGKIGEQLVARWCAAKGLTVTPSGDPEADLVIAGRRVEIKFSMLWEGGFYVFQQIRDQNYEYIICLGLSPFDAHCWVIPKHVALKHAKPQHTGKHGKDTYWLRIDPTSPPEWLRQYGGSLADACALLQKL